MRKFNDTEDRLDFLYPHIHFHRKSSHIKLVNRIFQYNNSCSYHRSVLYMYDNLCYTYHIFNLLYS